jgi:trans-aconitate 2-methyltransferase
MDWNAEQYHRVSEPQFEWGLQVLARVAALPPRGDETVLDAGCGTGRLTLHLAGLFPRGRVVATDVSAPMLQTFAKSLNNGREHQTTLGHASTRAGELGSLRVPGSRTSDHRFSASPDQRLSLVRADFQRLPFEGAFDIIFSTAAFHWAEDHDALFHSIHRALRRKGRVIAQCGGGANLAGVREREQILMHDKRLARFFRDWTPPWNYADVPTTRDRLVDAGFVDAEVWIENAPITMADRPAFITFAETVVERTQVALIPEPELRQEYLEKFADLAAGDYTFDYVRLNINAQRG